MSYAPITRSLLIGSCVLICFLATAQQKTLTITGQDIIDAGVHNNTRPGYTNSATTNYGANPRLADFAHGGYDMFFRSMLYFRLDSIPKGSAIQPATLYLYSDPTMTDPNSNNSNSQLSGSNAFYLEKITQEWSENTVTWSNQPATTTTGRVWVGPSTSTTENIQVSLTTIVQAWVNSPVTNNGLKMTVETELKYRARNYGSSYHSNASIRPKVAMPVFITIPDRARIPAQDRDKI